MKLRGGTQGFVNWEWGVCPLSQSTTASTPKPGTSVFYLGGCPSLTISSEHVKGWDFTLELPDFLTAHTAVWFTSVSYQFLAYPTEASPGVSWF